jgi:hypothetical protein
MGTNGACLLIHLFFYSYEAEFIQKLINDKYNYRNDCCLDLYTSTSLSTKVMLYYCFRGRRGRDRMVTGFTTSYAIGVYHH